MKKFSKHLETLLPFLILAVILLVLAVTTRGKFFTVSNMIVVVNQTLNIIIAVLGMIFVAALGATDITQGSLVGFAGAVATVVATKFGFFPAVAACLACGCASGLFLGVVNAKFKVPSFMCSLAMLIALRSLGTLAMGGSSMGIAVPDFIAALNNNAVKIPVVIILVVIVAYVFHKTRFGTYCQAIGENEKAVKFTGIHVNRIKIIAFVLSGLFTSIAALFVLARVGGCSTTLGLGFEMQIMMAMFIGGIPVEGGFGTRLYKALVGAFTIVVLENGLVLSGCSGAMTQLIRGLALLGVVCLTIALKNRILKANA